MATKRKPNSTNPAKSAESKLTPEQQAAVDELKNIQIEFDADGIAIIPASPAKDPAKQYRFRVPGIEGVIALPAIQHLPINTLMSLQGADRMQIMLDLFGKYCPQVLEEADEKQFMAIAAGWEQWSKKVDASPVTLGESLPSPQ